MELPEHLKGAKVLISEAVDCLVIRPHLAINTTSTLDSAWPKLTDAQQSAIVMASIMGAGSLGGQLTRVDVGTGVSLWGDGEILVRQEGVKRDAATQ